MPSGSDETVDYGTPSDYYGAPGGYGAPPGGYGGPPGDQGWGGWPQPPGPSQPPPRRRRSVLLATVIIVIALVLAAMAGAVFTRTVWSTLSGNPSGTSSTGGAGPSETGAQPNTDAGSSDSTPGDSGNGSDNGSGSGSGTIADPSKIAAAIAPTIVDVNTVLGLQNAQAAGTGIVLTSTGEVLTNNHVIAGSTSITVTDVGNGRSYKASVVGYDRSEDVAVIQLQGASGLATAPIGDSSKANTGDAIVALGNAGGTGGQPTAVSGSITATGQAITASDANGADAEHLTGLIQIAAAIQAGDSGGPLVDSSGHVIGMNTAATTGFRFQASGGQGFAIPINQAITLAKTIKAGHGSDTIHIGATAFLGVDVATSRSGTTGATIEDVVSGSAAEQAGLARGDAHHAARPASPRRQGRGRLP